MTEYRDGLGAGVAVGPPIRPADARTRFHDLLEQVPACAYVCEPDGTIAFYNRRSVELWGRAPALRDPADLYCGSHRLRRPDGTPVAHADCWMAKALAANRPFSGHEIVIERPDGGSVTALAFASPLRDDSGALVGGVNVLVDITEERHVEAEIRRLMGELQQSALRRTGSLVAAILGLQEALTRVKTLRGYVPICAHCQSIRDAAAAWDALERHLGDRHEAAFTHSVCDDCFARHYPEFLEPAGAGAAG